jgi:hypothetical protein
MHGKVALLALLCGSACASHENHVCEDIGDCTQGGSSTFIENCETEAKALEAEADTVGCNTPLENYYACADSNFECTGATSTFNGCAADLQSLDDCLSAAESATSCASLQAKESACTAPPDAGGPVAACTAARDCQAQCYPVTVSDVCAPRVDEIDAFQQCAAACPQ